MPNIHRTAIAVLLLALPAVLAASAATGLMPGKVSPLPGPEPAQAARTVSAPGLPTAAPCRAFAFEDAAYTVCTIDPATDDLRLFWQDRSGAPYRSFARLDAALEESGRHLEFAINAGMYSQDHAPVGLHIEDGRELSPADTKSIEGRPADVPNFYKKPNGVFFLDRAGAGILETGAFLRRAGSGPRFATQSGPMLVIDDRIHPAFIPGSTDRTWRSGVGVCEDGAVRFAVSDDTVNFHDFARLFRDGLSCRDALFLDGGRGVGLHDARTGRSDRSGHGGYGPIFGLVEMAAPD